MDNKQKSPKQAEEKYIFSYRKLVVPLSMRSVYWKYFGFPANEEEEILTKVKIVCTLCKMQIAYNRNTSNLRMHLQNKHLAQLQELEENATQTVSLSKLKEERATVKLEQKRERLGLSKSENGNSLLSLHAHQLDGDVEYLTEAASEGYDMEWESKALEVVNCGTKTRNCRPARPSEELDGIIFTMDKDAVTEFIIHDLEPACIVEGRGFQSLIATLRSPCEIPGKDKLEEVLLPKAYTTFREITLNTISTLRGNVGLVLEEWNHSNGQVYATFYVYYQTQIDEALEYKVLNTIHSSEFTDWNAVVNQLIVEWELQTNKITAVVVGSSEPRIFEAFRDKGFITIPCVLHTMQLCARSLLEREEVAAVLSRIRYKIGVISHSAMAMAAAELQRQFADQSQNDEAMLRMDYPQVWTSTYNMLETLRNMKGSIVGIMNSVEGATDDKNLQFLSEEDWQIVDDLLSVLAPFKMTISTLGEEKAPSISLLEPLLGQLTRSHLQSSEHDSKTVKTFKKILAKKLAEIYADGHVNLMLQTAMALDPRFKQLQYPSEDDRKNVATNIKSQLDKLVEKSNLLAVDDLPELPKKMKVSGLQFILGGLCSPTALSKPTAESGRSELSLYDQEEVASLEDDPLVWWSRARVRLPNLTRLAQQYFCVPAASIPLGRMSTETQILFEQKRARIAPELIETLVFLNGNIGSS